MDLSEDKKYILLCLSKDIIVGVNFGSFESMTQLRDDLNKVAQSNGLQLKIEELPTVDENGEEITSIPGTAQLTKLFSYLLDK